MDASAPGTDGAEPLVVPSPTPRERVLALIEILLCSDYPTQVALAGTFAAFGVRPQNGGSLSLTYVAGISLLDTLLLTGLIVFFLRARGDRPREVFFGGRPMVPELRAGVPLLFVAFGIALAILLAIQALAPWLHTVPHNPLQDLVKTPVDAAILTRPGSGLSCEPA